jgi:predicted amidohydrolase YtcJ
MADEIANPDQSGKNQPSSPKPAGDPLTEQGVSRRRFLAGAAAAGAAGVLGGPSVASAATSSMFMQTSDRDDATDLVLINGKIHTMDDDGTIARAVSIRNGRFAEVGNSARARGPGSRVVNLKGRTVVPGIIDNHNHIVLMGNRPGFHTPLENASSIAGVQETLAGRADGVPAGEWITTIGGFNINQFAEARFPTKAELDDAVPNHPVFVSQSFNGPSATNSTGADILTASGVVVGPDGEIAAGDVGATGAALLYLRQTLLTPETRRRGAVDAMAYGASLGVTTHLDQGAFQATGEPTDGAAHEDNFTMHIPFLELYREGELGTRLRVNFLNLEEDVDTPQLVARLQNAFPFFGGDLVKTGGIGEFTAGDFIQLFLGNPGPAWEAGTLRVAQAGWRNENHSLTPNDFGPIIEGWEAVNTQAPITDLRWVLAHVPFITEEYVDRLKDLGGGVSLTGWRYLAGTTEQNGPPFRMIVDNGIPGGMSSDGMQIAPMNPWLHMYYATTGVNAAGELINDGQQITREEVLRLYTSDNDWFLGEDDQIGSIAVGQHADLVVLSDDYFAVSDEDTKDIHSVLTLVGGKVVHDAGVV